MRNALFARPAALALLVACGGCELGGSTAGLDVDDRHRDQCVSELGAANAKLEAMGYEGIGDDPDKLVIVREPERIYNGGGQVWLEQAIMRGGKWEGMFLGGNWTLEHIMVVAQRDGSVIGGRFEHEWAHEILWKNGINATHHHGIMAQAGIPGR